MIWWWTGWQYLRPLLNTPLADTHALELTKSKSRALEEEMGGVGGGRNTFLYSSFFSPNLCVVLKEIKPWETWQHISHCIPSLIIGKWNVSRWIYGRGLLFSLPEAGPFFSVFLFCLSRAGEWIKQYELSVSEPSTGFRSTAAEKEKTIRMPIGCGSWVAARARHQHSPHPYTHFPVCLSVCL